MSWHLVSIKCTSRSFSYWHGLTLFPAWISNYIYYKVQDYIIYLFPSFNDAPVEVWEWMHNFHPTLYWACNYVSVLELKLTMLVREVARVRWANLNRLHNSTVISYIQLNMPGTIDEGYVTIQGPPTTVKQQCRSGTRSVSTAAAESAINAYGKYNGINRIMEDLY